MNNFSTKEDTKENRSVYVNRAGNAPAKAPARMSRGADSGSGHAGGSPRRSVTLKRRGEVSVSGKHIVIVTPSYPPFTNPRAFRWSAIAGQWAERGAHVRVIAGWTPGAVRQERYRGVGISRVGGGVVERVRAGLRKSGRETVADAKETAGRQKRSGVFKAIARRIARFANDVVWKQLYWPDYACLWIPTAVRALRRELKKQPCDSIITVSDPFSAHLVGAIIKRLNPEINWTVDIGDPFCFRDDTPTNNHALYRGLNYSVERRVFDAADAVTVTTEATANKYRELFPESADKIHVIGPLAQVPDTTETATQPRRDGVKRMVFVGSLYRNIRNPHFLLKLFERVMEDGRFDNWELHFYGGYDGCQSYFKPYRDIVGRRIFLHGLHRRETVLKAMKDADALVNIGNDNVYQLPSKVMEYAVYGKPILHVSRIGNDCSTEFFRQRNLALCLHSETGMPDDSQVEAVKEFLSHPVSRATEETVSQLLEEASAQAIAARYADVMLAKETNGTSKRSSQTAQTHATWHCYYATRGAAGAYVDALLKASQDAGLNARAFVSAWYEYSTGGAVRIFFPFTDRLNNRGAVLRILRGIELLAAYAVIGVAAIFKRPRIVIHLIDDLQTTKLFFYLCRFFGLETWLTCHDVRSHYLGANSRRRRMMQAADRLIVHNTAAYNELIAVLGDDIADKVKRYPFPFSSYDDIITPEGIAQAEQTLQKLIPDGPGFYLFLGVVRNSKGIETLIDAWTALERSPDKRLVIAGVWTDPSPELRKKAERDKSITIIDRYLTDEEFVTLISQARFTVLPYDEYAHSSVIMSCANHGGAVITSDIPLFTEFCPDSEWVFERGNATDLQRVLQKAFTADDTAVRKAGEALKEALERQNKRLIDEMSRVFRGEET